MQPRFPGVAVALAMTLAACGAPTSSPQAPLGVGLMVTASMYSGREDPRFVLSEAAAADLRSCLGDPAGQVAVGRVRSGLGFRFFHVKGLLPEPLYVDARGAWTGGGGPETATPIPLCNRGFANLRAVAVGALPAQDAENIPNA